MCLCDVVKMHGIESVCSLCHVCKTSNPEDYGDSWVLHTRSDSHLRVIFAKLQIEAIQRANFLNYKFLPKRRGG